MNIRNDALLIWFWAGVIITIGCAAQVVLFDEDGAQVSEIRDLAVLSSPIFYMVRAIRDICNAEAMAMKCECKIGLEGISKENPVQIGEKGLDEIEESSFVCMARRREEIRPLDSGDQGSFNIRDLRWVGFVSRNDAAGARVPMMLNPSLIFTLLGLACLSCAVICRVVTAKPELLGLHTLGGMITPKFSPQTTAYSVYTFRSQQVLGLTAEVNPRETSRLSLQTEDRILNSTWGSVVDSIGLGQHLYPIQAQVSVKDAASTSRYQLDILEWGLVPESLTFTGTTKLNKHFHRCIPYGYMHPGSTGILSAVYAKPSRSLKRLPWHSGGTTPRCTSQSFLTSASAPPTRIMPWSCLGLGGPRMSLRPSFTRTIQRINAESSTTISDAPASRSSLQRVVLW